MGEPAAAPPHFQGAAPAAAAMAHLEEQVEQVEQVEQFYGCNRGEAFEALDATNWEFNAAAERLLARDATPAPAAAAKAAEAPPGTAAAPASSSIVAVIKRPAVSV